MAPKVFVTGGTGYIGGDFLAEAVPAHTEWEITCMVRNSDKGAKIATVYPKVRLVYGDLDSVELLEEEASKSDIVFHFADCDHTASAEAIIRGLARRDSTAPAFLIHTSGTLILGWKTMQEGSFGDTQSKVYDDWDGVSELVNLPDGAAHRHVDKIVLAAPKTYPGKIKTAIVCPPTIYGEGRGPDNRRSIQVYKTAEAFLKHGRGFMVGKGENAWREVHVQDLSRLYLSLGEAAAAGGEPATWDDQGYYLAENGRFVWGDIMSAVAKETHKQGYLSSPEAHQLAPEETDKISEFFKFATGTDSQGKAIRGRKLLNWEPKENGLLEEIPKIVESEATRLGLLKGHAQKVVEG